jgi:hypothetical protein
MSDGLPTEEQLRRMEQRVMTRIRRRAQLPKRIATGAAVAALFAGGVFLLPRLGVTGSSGGSGSSAGYASNASRGGSGGSTALLASCHAADSATSPVRTVPLTHDTPAAAIDACLRAFEKDQGPKATTSSGSATDQLVRPLTAKDLVVCRDGDRRLQVFVKDAHPSTLCGRNGMHAP